MNSTSTIGDISTDLVTELAIDGEGLDQEQVRDILARRVRAAAMQAEHREPGLAVIVCTIGGERFAVPLTAIAEVLPAVKPTRVPGAPDNLAGLIVNRGLVYNLVDPAPSLGVRPGTSSHMLLLRGPVPRLALRGGRGDRDERGRRRRFGRQWFDTSSGRRRRGEGWD